MANWRILRRVVNSRGRPRADINESDLIIQGEEIEFELIYGADLLYGQWEHAQQGANWSPRFSMAVYPMGGSASMAEPGTIVSATPQRPRHLRFRFRASGRRRLFFQGASVSAPHRSVAAPRPGAAPSEPLFPPVEGEMVIEVVDRRTYEQRRASGPLAGRSRQQALATMQGEASQGFRHWQREQAVLEREQQASPGRQRSGVPNGVLDFRVLPEQETWDLTMGEFSQYMDALNRAVMATPVLDLSSSTHRQFLPWRAPGLQQGSGPILPDTISVQLNWQVEDWGGAEVRISATMQARGILGNEMRMWRSLVAERRIETAQFYPTDSWLVVRINGGEGRPVGPVLMTPRALIAHQTRLTLLNLWECVERVADIYDFFTFVTAAGGPALFGTALIGRGLRAAIRRARSAIARLGREAWQSARRLLPRGRGRPLALPARGVDDAARGASRGHRAAGRGNRGSGGPDRGVTAPRLPRGPHTGGAGVEEPFEEIGIQFGRRSVLEVGYAARRSRSTFEVSQAELRRIAEEIFDNSPVLQELARLSQGQVGELREGVEQVLRNWHHQSGYGIEIVNSIPAASGRASLFSRRGYLQLSTACLERSPAGFHESITHELAAYYSWRHYRALGAPLPRFGEFYNLPFYLEARVLHGRWL
ncbi:hypothetical protein [Dethiosulfatarculus sandiegensis]|uniref:Uncharacterized protein n=1 Tax=Dethiosulfatarculus sandiegensis TaxID=1429043 RepID=A0A0D2JBT0_9BACT|nr:hypothetical protein [Dethiosulfatarculus sandiegensis]KIX13246.1 hypothetical protein X474_14615 [Dethiosulfatarculus sandiegensis]